ncbi:hypothetical protein LCM20_14960 [Halobacillus litoralis]|uniref:hypothetical protein n=1 Tax=Halobacillus litoralis TaxID=45668 RepID=UPI001CD3218F|nr:hypothetical protein [Halobacillus litoralis]MCA0971904.1 hypothetical protein [Halobacillus litoralis]
MRSNVYVMIGFLSTLFVGFFFILSFVTNNFTYGYASLLTLTIASTHVGMRLIQSKRTKSKKAGIR